MLSARQGPLRLALFAAALWLGCTSSLASAQGTREAVTVVDPIDIPPENDPLAHAFDVPGERSGFYLRLSTSLGFENTRLGPAGWESDIEGSTATGFATGYNVHVGGLLRTWLALHLDANVGVLWNGDVEELSVLGDYNQGARIITYGLAPAVTFFTPHDFYFTPAFGVGFASIQMPGEDESTDPGFYMNLVAGKDIYVAPHMYVGLQFQVVYMMLGHEDVDYEARVRQFLFGVSFGFDGGR